MKDLPKWITVGVLLLGIFAGAVAWATSMEGRLAKVEDVAVKVNRMDRFMIQLAERLGMKYE